MPSRRSTANEHLAASRARVAVTDDHPDNRPQGLFPSTFSGQGLVIAASGSCVMRSLVRSLLLAAGVISIGSVAGVSVAMAADVVRPPPVIAKPVIVAPAFNWTGHY